MNSHDDNIGKPEMKGQDTVRWVQLLRALDQQGTNKISTSSKVDNFIDIHNSSYLFPPRMKEPVHSKLPEAVVAFAQAAAKANGEPEKYLPGWPLLYPPKVQLQKCSKCSLEFCSPVNYRRHLRAHRRALNNVKDSYKMRNLLAAFWDKLSPDEAIERFSFHNETLEGVTGSSIIMALSSCMHKPGFSSLPQKYLKAGEALLDVLHAKPSSLSITSEKLFSVLEDASEKTFLVAGTALSLQKYMFDGEVWKNALEMKNLVATASFFLEQILVKAWIADKDTEALRCQKLLVEEEEAEEAAQKRKTELVKKRKLKKLRQREQKAKQMSDGVETDAKVEDTSSSGSPSARAQMEIDTTISDKSLDESSLLTEPRDVVEQSERDLQPYPQPQQFRPKKNRTSVNKIWTRKSRTKSRAELESREVVIGSINISLRDAKQLNVPKKDDTFRSGMKLWRPVSREKVNNNLESNPVSDLTETRPFSSEVAESFLAQRWKEAIAADHVKLVLPRKNERIILADAENRIFNVSKPKFRPKKNEKSYKLKYVQKHKSEA